MSEHANKSYNQSHVEKNEQKCPLITIKSEVLSA